MLRNVLLVVEKVLRKRFLVFSIFLKSKAVLSFGFGFSMSENPRGRNIRTLGLKYAPKSKTPLTSYKLKLIQLQTPTTEPR